MKSEIEKRIKRTKKSQKNNNERKVQLHDTIFAVGGNWPINIFLNLFLKFDGKLIKD